jgi:hypothetical protein
LRSYDKTESSIEVRTYWTLIALGVETLWEMFFGVKLLREKVWGKLIMDFSLEMPLEILLLKNLSLTGFKVLTLLREALRSLQISMRNSINSLVRRELWHVRTRVSTKRSWAQMC